MYGGYGSNGAGMWVFGGLMMLGMIVLAGLVVWGVLRLRDHPRAIPAALHDATGAPTAEGRAGIRLILDERYARGELSSDEYAERLRTLGW